MCVLQSFNWFISGNILNLNITKWETRNSQNGDEIIAALKTGLSLNNKQAPISKVSNEKSKFPPVGGNLRKVENVLSAIKWGIVLSNVWERRDFKEFKSKNNGNYVTEVNLNCMSF